MIDQLSSQVHPEHLVTLAQLYVSDICSFFMHRTSLFRVFLEHKDRKVTVVSMVYLVVQANVSVLRIR